MCYFLADEDVAHGGGGFFLRRGGYMGIGIEGKACGKVPQHAGDRLDVHPILQCQSGEGMPKLVEVENGD